MTDETISLDSPVVARVMEDAELAVELVTSQVKLSYGVLVCAVRELRSELKVTQDDIRTLKLKIAGLEIENGKLQERLKKRFGGIDNRLEQVEKRSSCE